MPKVLLIAYHFPPDAAVGSTRPAKFVKYLRRLGWQPHILTVQDEHVVAKDFSRLEDVAGVPVVRTPVWPTVLELALSIKRALLRWSIWRRRDSVSGSPHGAHDVLPSSGLTGRLKRYLNSLLELPDRQVGWLIPAVRAAHRLVRTEQIELVVTSSPPRTTALVGLLLSYVARVKLVTDLRDPWFVPRGQDPLFRVNSSFAGSRSPAGDLIEQWLERKLFRRSAIVITTTERHARALREAYPWLPEDRIRCIPNGYDAQDLENIDRPARSEKFTVSYLGTLYLFRTPKQFFEALAALIREGALSPSEIEVNLIGHVFSTADGSMRDLIDSYGLADCVRVSAPVSYKESLRRMVHSDALLLFAAQELCTVPAKTFEYLAARKPILCLSHDGATADLIAQTGAGLVVEPEDVDAIKAAIWRLFQDFKTGQAMRYQPDISSFEREALARQLSGLLSDLLSSTPVRCARANALAGSVPPSQP